MYKSIILISFILFHSCGDKVKTNQEKIIGTWIGYLEGSTSKNNTDTFIFTNSILTHNSPSGKKIYNGYTISNNIIQYSILGNLESIYQFEFSGDNVLSLKYLGATFGNQIKFYLKKDS